MSQQLQLLLEPPSTALNPTSGSDKPDPLLEQTRQLFQHRGSNTELMAQILNAIQALNEICEQPKH